MVSISFTALRQNAKSYFDAVEKGEIVRVLRHGKVIAEITAPRRETVRSRKIIPQVIPGILLSKAILKERVLGR